MNPNEPETFVPENMRSRPPFVAPGRKSLETPFAWWTAIGLICAVTILPLLFIVLRLDRENDTNERIVDAYDHINWPTVNTQLIHMRAEWERQDHEEKIRRIGEGVPLSQIRREEEESRQKQMADDLRAIRQKLEKTGK